MAEPMFAIALGSARDPHREAVQTIVKAHASEWWHRFPDLWIVQGQTASYWRDLIGPTLLNSRASVLVLRLPDQADRRWAAQMPYEGMSWLYEAYAGIPDPNSGQLPSATDDIVPF